MIVALKIIIEEDKKVSLVLYKSAELTELLESTITVLELTFPNVRITSRDDHYHIAGIVSAGMFATIKSYIEEVYIRFIDKDDSEVSEFEKYFFI